MADADNQQLSECFVEALKESDEYETTYIGPILKCCNLTVDGEIDINVFVKSLLAKDHIRHNCVLDGDARNAMRSVLDLAWLSITDDGKLEEGNEEAAEQIRLIERFFGFDKVALPTTLK